jgi:hypothetical protein
MPRNKNGIKDIALDNALGLTPFLTEPRFSHSFESLVEFFAGEYQ